MSSSRGRRIFSSDATVINAVADIVNRDRSVNEVLRVVFVPDFDVKVSQRMYPAADLSEQISTAGKEASGTGNMKFMMNGALTIGTLDGANLEIREAVGPENFFLFGQSAQQVEETLAAGYRPRAIYEQDQDLRNAIDLIDSGRFSHGDADLFRPLTDNLRDADPFLVCADFRGYLDGQSCVDLAHREPDSWTRMSIFNVSRSGRFSSDRAIREYGEHIWRVSRLPVATRV